MKLHSKVVGEGKPLLVLHGLFGSGDNWATLASSFAREGYFVHLIDQRNHGRSPHDDVFDYEVMAADLQEYIHDHRINNPLLIGHSMGGKTIMRHAQLFAGVPEKIIVVDIAPRYYPPHHQVVIEALSSIDFSKAVSRKSVQASLELLIHDSATLQFLLKNLYWKDDEQLAWRFNLSAIASNILDIGTALPTEMVDIPTLFLRGENAGYLLPSDEELIQKQFTNASIKTIAKAGHWVHVDNPALFFSEALAFLKA